MFKKILFEACNRYHLVQGKNETALSYKARIVYSICGMMAYTSLLDESDESIATISKVNLKYRVKDILDSYLSLMPELKDSFSNANFDIAESIYQTFLDAGVIYSSPYRLAISKRVQLRYDKVTFMRGISPDEIDRVSGIGFYGYELQPKDAHLDPLAAQALSKVNTKDLKALRAMFGLETESLSKRLHVTLNRATWHKSYLDKSQLEFLRTDGPFTLGYWVNKDKKSVSKDGTPLSTAISEYGNTFGLLSMIEPEAQRSDNGLILSHLDAPGSRARPYRSQDDHRDLLSLNQEQSTEGMDNVLGADLYEDQSELLGEIVSVSGSEIEAKAVSILRCNGSYYLYFYRDEELIISPLPMWMMENGMYRTICCAILKERQAMPPIDYTMDGNLVHVHLNYLLPRPELNLLRLYSWPESFTSSSPDFARCLNKEVFVVLKDLLISQGYEFLEGLS
ncbi:hypothetical protein [uncultured Anaerobiospirillum sp.]|uniref:hypothetical protein n=1 Tax=uncultured Anaerobiospirillum sp. TaxID=265728 RepID=UPI002803E18D|nr:hypothetical protein [uncultured Anaerobiospirillum sp.]